tara:strand:- start:69 stop:386 length:318 start_codon:yes stop_codon:yes gene_type:complete
MILLGLLYSCSPAVAQTYFSKKPVICGTTEEIIEQVKKHGELPFLRGNGVSMKEDGSYAISSYIMGFNQKTGTFTLIEVLATGTACILGNGKGLEMFSPEKGINL